jgi:hypothetical protein
MTPPREPDAIREAVEPRCGDHVLHRPSGEQWVVAWAEGGRIAWAGWPPGTALSADCDVVRRCSDDEHRRQVAMCEGSRSVWREKVLRLYDVERAAKEAGDA